MDEQSQQPAALSASFPPPPPFYLSFSPDNLKAVSSLRAASASAPREHDPAISLPLRILNLPPELRHLQPPIPPEDGKFRCFGDVYDLQETLPTLEAMDVQQVYTPPSSPSPSGLVNAKHHNRAFILKRLAKSLLLNFLELVAIMSTNPSQYSEKVSEIRTLFVNFHHLLNEYRPHQARETLILMMQEQLDRAREEVQSIKKMKRTVEKVFEGMEVLGAVDDEKPRKVEEVMDRDREVWDALKHEFG